MTGWMIVVGAAVPALLAVVATVLVRLDRRVAEELRQTDDDRKWTSSL